MKTKTKKTKVGAAPKKSKLTKVYRFGLRKPTENVELIEKQLSLRHKYDKRLTWLELWRRKYCDRTLRRFHPKVVELDAELTVLNSKVKELTDKLKALRAESRKRVRCPELNAEIKAAKAEVTPIEEAFKEAKAIAWAVPKKIEKLRERMKEAYDELPAGKRSKEKPQRVLNLEVRLREAEEAWRSTSPFQTRLYEIETVFRRLHSKARKRCGLFWGTYMQVEAEADKFREGPPPKYPRWTGAGRLSAQLQKGMPVEGLQQMGGNNVLQVDLLPEEVFTGTARTKRVLGRTTLRMRLGSTGSNGRDPVFGVWPMLQHRALPAGGRIKWVHVLKKKIGPRVKWEVHLNIDMPAGHRPADCADTGMIAVHLCWRLRPGGGLRVGYMMNRKGQHNEIRMTAREFERFDVADGEHGLRSTRDKNFDKIRAFLAEWAESSLGVPEWFILRTEHMPKWKAPRKLAALTWHWSKNRFQGDDKAFEAAEAWRKQDRHLWLWETSERTSARTWRLDWYRRLAAELRRKYRTILVPDFDLRKVAKKEKVTDDKQTQTEQMRRQRMTAAPSELRASMQQCGANCVKIPCKWTTKTCHKCRKICKFDAATVLVHTCEHCGEEWDQDYNNCCNMLSSDEAKAAE